MALASIPPRAGGAYVIFMMEEGQDRVKAIYKYNYDRLRRQESARKPNKVSKSDCKNYLKADEYKTLDDLSMNLRKNQRYQEKLASFEKGILRIIPSTRNSLEHLSRHVKLYSARFSERTTEE